MEKKKEIKYDEEVIRIATRISEMIYLGIYCRGTTLPTIHQVAIKLDAKPSDVKIAYDALLEREILHKIKDSYVIDLKAFKS